MKKKGLAERLRGQRIKNDPVKYDQQTIKEQKKYENKKDKLKLNQTTSREQRKARKFWT